MWRVLWKWLLSTSKSPYANPHRKNRTVTGNSTRQPHGRLHRSFPPRRGLRTQAVWQEGLPESEMRSVGHFTVRDSDLAFVNRHRSFSGDLGWQRSCFLSTRPPLRRGGRTAYMCRASDLNVPYCDPSPRLSAPLLRAHRAVRSGKCLGTPQIWGHIGRCFAIGPIQAEIWRSVVDLVDLGLGCGRDWCDLRWGVSQTAKFRSIE